MYFKNILNSDLPSRLFYHYIGKIHVGALADVII